MKTYSYILYFFLFVQSFFAQAIFTEEDVAVCSEKFEFAESKNLSDNPINEIIVEIGKSFLGLEYEAFTLEKGKKEQLVINLTGLDCYTFFESSLTFARCIKKGKTTFKDFQNAIINTRYRNGKLKNYPSRLHYASDWLYDNNKRGIVKDITAEIGGIAFDKKINFMSTHSFLYKRLKNNPKFVEEIKSIEDSINARDYYYIPENFIECVEDKIQNGDILLLTASTKGLDISHTGIAIEVEGRIHFMHAPQKGKKIQITEKPLGEYLRSLKRHTGIMVARSLEP